jgi:RimJ/RimL family protein N-acetyltransferase
MSVEPTYNPMVGRRVLLKPVTPGDTPFINDLASTPVSGAIWRWRGSPIAADPIHALWPNTLAAFVVMTKEKAEPVALAVAVNGDMLSRTCMINYVAHPDLDRTGWHLEGTLLFINYVFRVWEMRKIYGEVLSHNSGIWSRSKGRGIAREEGRLRDHILLDGRYHDLIYLAVYREPWLSATEGLMRRITGYRGYLPAVDRVSINDSQLNAG